MLQMGIISQGHIFRLAKKDISHLLGLGGRDRTGSIGRLSSVQKFPPVRFRSGFRRGAGVGVGFGRNPGALGRFGRASAGAPRPAAANVRRRSGPQARARGSGRGGGSASRGPAGRAGIAGFPPGGTPSAPSPRRGGEHPAGGNPVRAVGKAGITVMAGTVVRRRFPCPKPVPERWPWFLGVPGSRSRCASGSGRRA